MKIVIRKECNLYYDYLLVADNGRIVVVSWKSFDTEAEARRSAINLAITLNRHTVYVVNELKDTS